jgi:glycosyltransferase involved in cell wall biosynthesis
MHCNQFDIVHTHQFEAGLIFRIAAWITGVPVTVFTYHSTHFPRQRTGHYMIDRALALRTTQLIAVSEAAKISVSQQLRLSLGQFLVIPNFVHLKEITILSTNEKQTKRLHLDLKTDQFVIISIGRLEVPKGFSTLLEAIRIVKEKFHDLILLLVGEGSLRTQLQQLAVELKIQNEVRFLGVRKDVYVLLQLSDIFVMSSWWEGMPIALLEAGACGLPAIASAVGGITEIVSEGVNGLLVPPQDSEALALRIIDLLTKPDLRHRMGIRARKIIEEKFSSDVVGYQLGGLYERLLTQRLNQ